jgi:hypothetical protein
MGQTVIEINGIKYDATTGSVITTMPPTAPKQAGHNIDGIVAQHRPTHTQLASPTHTQQPTYKKFQPTIGRAVHDVTMVHHQHTIKSKTLMRSVVKKPGATVALPASEQTSPVHHTGSYTASSTHTVRLGKALTTPTHASVTRFNLTPAKVQPTVTHLPVATEQGSYSSAPAFAPTLHHVKHTTSAQTSAQFVDSQLAKQAISEESPFKKKPLRKRISNTFSAHKIKSFSTIALATLLLGGFIVYQNTPTISLALANRDAGITAKIPKGIPSNFAIDKDIEASKGQVTLTFKSRTDDRNFTLTQQTANINNAELEAALTASYHKGVQSYETSGLKLYITSDGSADWIDGNMRFNLSGVSGLSSEQLATIARSL